MPVIIAAIINFSGQGWIGQMELIGQRGKEKGNTDGYRRGEQKCALIDTFEAVMMREDRTKGFFVTFDFSSDAMGEIGAFFRKTGKSIIALTVKDILDEQIAHKLA